MEKAERKSLVRCNRIEMYLHRDDLDDIFCGVKGAKTLMILICYENTLLFTRELQFQRKATVLITDQPSKLLTLSTINYMTTMFCFRIASKKCFLLNSHLMMRLKCLVDAGIL